MRKAIVGLLVVVLLVGGIHLPAVSGSHCKAKKKGFFYYVPLVIGDVHAMANISALENIEGLVQKPGDFPFDGWISEIQKETVSVKLVTTDQIKRNVRIPDHIPLSKLKKGIPVRLGTNMGEPILLAILPQFETDINYAGKGSIIPDPPHLTVQATQYGWQLTWTAMAGADRYRVYRNDTPDETSPEDLGYVTGTSLVVPSEAPYIYFAIRSVSGLNESELSAWCTDDTAPPEPTTFDVEDDIQGHRLLISALDASLNDPGFKCWEVQQADDAGGTNTVGLGQMGLSDFPRLIQFPQGTTRYYRARALDMADNASDWTAWQPGFAIITGMGQTIQDKFDTYGGNSISSLESLWWLKIGGGDFEQLWTRLYPDVSSISLSQSNVIEGQYSNRVQTSGSIMSIYRLYSPSLDFSQEGRFTQDDYILLHLYLTEPADHIQDVVGIELWNPDNSNIFFHAKDWAGPTIPAGDVYVKIKRSDGIVTGSFDWSNIDRIYLLSSRYQSITAVTFFDDLRIVKADPDDATTYSDTGASWDKAAPTGNDTGEWHIYAGNRSGEPSKPFSYGQIKTAASPALWYLSHKPLTTTDIISGTIQAGVYLKGSNGQAGLSFFVKDVTAGSWDMYAIEADSAADQVRLVKWVGGTRTVISTASFTFGPNQILWLGADFRDYDADGGRIRVYASLSEGNLIQASRMVISAQDTQWLGDAGGSVGLLSYQANVRFVNLVAGSPAHADVADVSHCLDGTIVGGENRRVSYNRDTNQFEYSDDGGVTVNQVGTKTNAANTAVVRDASGDVVARLFRPEFSGGGGGSFNYVNVQNAVGAGVDNFMRAATLAEFRARLGLMTKIGTYNIPSDGWISVTGLALNNYEALLVTGFGISTRAIASSGLFWRFNSDAGNNYIDVHLTGAPSGPLAGQTATTSGGIAAINGANYLAHSQFMVFVPFVKAAVWRHWIGLSYSNGLGYAQVRGGVWVNGASEITRIDFFDPNAPSGNLYAGSQVTLWGIGS